MKTDLREIYKDERGIGMGKTLFTTHNFLDTPRSCIILECGFGQGEVLRHLLEYENSVYGIDVSDASCREAIQEGWGEKCALINIDIGKEHFPFINNFFDYVFITETIEHVTSPLHCMQEIRRVLKPNGYVITSFPDYAYSGYIGGLHAHTNPGMLTPSNFKRLMMQLYFKFTKEVNIGNTCVFMHQKCNERCMASILRNDPEDMVNIYKVAAGNYGEDELYGHLNVPGLLDLTKMKWYRTKNTEEIACPHCGCKDGLEGHDHIKFESGEKTYIFCFNCCWLFYG